MQEGFKLEIISPEKVIFSDEVPMATIPSYEGDMTILKDHISIITFLRPGIIKTKKNDGNSENFFVQDGTIEFFNNKLVILSASAINIKNVTKDFLQNLNEESQNKLQQKEISDYDRYMLNHKIDTIRYYINLVTFNI